MGLAAPFILSAHEGPHLNAMHADFLDRCSHRTSMVHRLDPRLKVGVALALTLGILALPAPWWWPYAAMSIVVLGLYALARVPWGHLLKRLAVLLPFLVLMAAGVPLSRGLSGGFDIGARLLARSLLCITVMITLVATTPFPQLLWALERFRFPRILLLILAFMYRYMFVLTDELQRMRRGRLARSFGRRRWMEWSSLGSFAGLLFIRAFERAERVYAAMCARGWNGRFQPPDAGVPGGGAA